MNMLALRILVWYAPLSFVAAILVGGTNEWAVAMIINLFVAAILVWDFEIRRWKLDDHAGQAALDAEDQEMV